MALDPNNLQGMFGSGGLVDAMAYNKLKQLQAMQEQLGQSSETQRKLAMLETVHLMIRDLATVQAGIPQLADAYRHPAAASMYKHLNDISTALTNLRRTSQQNL